MSAYLGQQWQCPSCQAWNEPDTLACARCGAGAPYPTLAEAESGAAKVAFLLAELEKWRDQRLVTDAAYQTLHQQYGRRHERLVRVPRIERLLQDARYANGQGRADDALRWASEALGLDPENDRALDLLGALHEQGGRLEDALAAYEAVARRRPGSAEADDRVRRVRDALEARQQSAAQQAALDAIRARSGRGEKAEALAACVELLRAHPDSADGCALLASFYREADRVGDALPLLQRAASLQPANRAFADELNSVRALLRAREEEERRQRNRSRVALLVGTARALLEKGSVEDALRACQEAVELDPEEPLAYALAAEAYERTSRWRSAEAAWQQARRLVPENADYLTRLRAASEHRRLAERPLPLKVWDAGTAALETFMEAHNIGWILLLAVALLLASGIGIAAWVVTAQKLWGVVGRSIALALCMLTTAGCWAAGLKAMPRVRATALGYLTIALLLVPLDAVVLKPLFPGIVPLGWHTYACLIAAVTTYLSVDLAARLRARRFVVLAGVGFLVFVLLLIGMRHPSSPGVYAFWLSVIGFAYLFLAQSLRGGENPALAAPLDVLAHAVMTGSLVVAFAPGLLGAAGSSTSAVLAVLVISSAYGTSAYISEQVKYVPIFSTLLFVFVAFGLNQRGLGVEEWYQYGLAFGVVGSAFLGVLAPVSRKQEGREQYTQWYEGYGLVATAGVLLLLFGRGLVDALLYTRLPVGPELAFACLTALLIGGVHALGAFLGQRPSLLYGSIASLSYGVVLLARLQDRPANEYSLYLALAAVGAVWVGKVLQDAGRGDYALPPWRAGQALAGLSAGLALALWLHHGVLPALRGGEVQGGYREAAFVVLLLSTGIYACIARWRESAAHVYPATACAALAWGAAVSWLDEWALAGVLGAERNYGAYFFPAVVALALAGRALRARARSALAVPCEEVAFELATAALVAQAYLASTVSGLRHSVWLSLLAYGAGFTWAAARCAAPPEDASSSGEAAADGEPLPFGWRTGEVYVYLAALSVVGGLFYGLGRAGMPREFVALLGILVGSVATGGLAAELHRRGQPRLVRALLACAALSFAAAWAYQVGLESGQVMLGVVGAAALAVALIYARAPEEVLPVALLSAGAGSLALGAFTFGTGGRTGMVSPPLLAAGALAASGVLYARLARVASRDSYAYLAVFALEEAGVLAANGILGPLGRPGVGRLSLVVLGAAALPVGQALSRRKEIHLARACHGVGHAFAAAGILVSLALWGHSLLPADQVIALAATALGAGVYIGSAAAARAPLFLYPAGLSLAAAYALAGAHWVMPGVDPVHANYGLWLLPLLAGLTACGHLLSRRGQAAFGRPLLHVAALAAVASIAAQFPCAPVTTFPFFFLCAALLAGSAAAAGAWDVGAPVGPVRQALAYAAASSFAAGWLLLFEWLGGPLAASAEWRALASLTGLAWGFAGYGAYRAAARKRSADAELPWWALPVFNSALAWAGVCLAWVSEATAPPLAPLLAVATLVCLLYSLMAVESESEALGCFAAVGFALGCLAALTGAAAPQGPAVAWWGTVAPLLYGLSLTGAAGCMGWLTAHFRSRGFSALATVSASLAFLCLADAAVVGTALRAPGWHLVALALLAWAMQGAALILRRRGCPELASAPALAADLAASITLVGVLLETDPSFGFPVGTAALALAAGAHALSAWARGEPLLLYLSGLSAAAGLGLAGPTLLRGLPDENYGLLYLPFVALFAALGYAARARGQESFAEPLHHEAFLVSLCCLVLQPAYAAFGTAPAYAAGTLLGLAILYAGASCLEGSAPTRAGVLTYLACAALAGAVLSLPAPALRPVLWLAIVVLGAAWTALALLLRERKLLPWVGPLLVSAGCAAAVGGLAAAAASEPSRLPWDAATVTAGTAVLFWVSIVARAAEAAHVGCGLAALGYLGLLFGAGSAGIGREWIPQVPLLAAAVGAAAMALWGEWPVVAFWSPLLLVPVGIGCLGAAVSAAALPEATPAGLSAAAMAACAVMYYRLSRTPLLARLAWFAPLAGAGAYWQALAVGHRLAGLPDPARTLSLAVLPYILLLGYLETRERSEPDGLSSRPNLCVALCVGLPALFSGLPPLWDQPWLVSLALFLHAAAYCAGAALFGSSALLWLGCSLFGAAWVHTAWRPLALVPHSAALGLCLAMLGLLYLVVGLALRRVDREECHAGVLLALAAGTAGVGGSAGWLDAWLSPSHASWALAALALAALVYGVLAFVRRTASFICLANVALILSWHALYLELGFQAGGALPGMGAWFALLGTLQVAAGMAFRHAPVPGGGIEEKRRLPEPARIQYGLGVAVSSVAAVVALFATPTAQHLGHWTIAALALSAFCHAAMAVVFRQVGYAHASFAATLAGLYLIFYGKLGLKTVDMLNIYALPFGAYFLWLPWVHRYIGREVHPGPLHGAGLGLLLGSGLLSLLQKGFMAPSSILLLVESVAAFMYGMARRMKVFFLFGLGFTLVWVGVLIYEAVSRAQDQFDLPVPWILTGVVGIGLFWLGSRSEKERERLKASLLEQARKPFEWE